MSFLKNENFASSLLIATVTDVGTSIVLTAATGALFPSTGYFMMAIWGSAYASPSLDPNRELVKATLVSGDTFTIVRAQEGTTNKAWAIGDNVALVFTAGKMEEVEGYVQNNLTSFGIATGTNTYTAVLDPAITAYTNGMAVNIKFTNASTGASTLALNALASKKIYRVTDGAYVQIGSGDIIAGLYSTAFYDSSLDASAGGWKLVSAIITVPVVLEAGTALLFPQAAAPTGWTIDSSWSTPRSILIGNSYTNGGTDSATTYTTAVTVGAHATHRHTGANHTHTGPSHVHSISIGGTALSISQIPSHTHTFECRNSGSNSPFRPLRGLTSSSSNTETTNATGSGATHTHSGASGAAGTGATGAAGTGYGGYGGPTTHTVGQSTYSPRYLTVIRATKDA